MFKIQDVRIDTYMGGGESVRMFHIPSGYFVCKESPGVGWHITRADKQELIGALEKRVERGEVVPTNLEMITVLKLCEKSLNNFDLAKKLVAFAKMTDESKIAMYGVYWDHYYHDKRQRIK